MSVLAKIREIIATMGDGHSKAIEHVAAEVDALKQTGLPAADLQKLMDAFEQKAKSFFDSVDAEVRGRLATLEESVHELQGKVLAQAPAAPPAATSLEAKPATDGGANQGANEASSSNGPADGNAPAAH